LEKSLLKKPNKDFSDAFLAVVPYYTPGVVPPTIPLWAETSAIWAIRLAKALSVASMFLTTAGNEAQYSLDIYLGGVLMASREDETNTNPQVVAPALADFASPDPNDPCGDFSNFSNNLSEGYSRVGRWMSKTEYEAMKTTGKVQEGLGGSTRVAFPASPNTYRNAPLGDRYVEFNVPTSSLKPHSQGTMQIPGPNSLYGRIATSKGNTIEMPDFHDMIDYGDCR
jgi:hypothetical protein